MASYRKLPSGLWQAQIFRKGIRKSDSFKSKGAAIAWAGREESEIEGGARGSIPNRTVKDLLERYEREVTPGKKGARWEVIRLRLFGRDRIAQVRLRQLDSPHVADWQKRRLEDVASASVRRERNLLNNVFEIARKEWKWLVKNPFEGVRRPRDGKPRNRIASQAELDKLTKNASPELARAIIIAVETAMRQGENASQPEIHGRIAKLVDSKNGEAREVPLSAKALEAFEGGIGLTAGSISALFARLCDDEKVKNLTFHDLKHTAMTRLSKKLDPWELAKMTGNKDMNLILRVYYQHDPQATVEKLD
jgi:integrase